MMFSDSSRGWPYAKDPAVVELGAKAFMYYSIPPYGDGRKNDGWAIGVATSVDLDYWEKLAEIPPRDEPGAKRCPGGICAPGAVVLDGVVHLFYQTYGNGRNDAICHATSADGVHFSMDSSNPVFSPTGDWNCGRAIDADVIAHDGKLFLYFSTRDPDMKIQMTGVATAALDSGFSRGAWRQRCDAPVLRPELPWEQDCVEASALCEHAGKLYMFYGGAYNNCPQQIGCAVSEDGLTWKRLSDKPFLPNGRPGEWNSSESGHPFAFKAKDGAYHLFFQGNDDGGKTWRISRRRIVWEEGAPRLAE